MIDLTPNICRIESLLTAGDDPSLAYAALECRLAIEAIVYDRCLSTRSYTAIEEFKRYQPGQIIKDLISLVGDAPVEEATVWLSLKPIDPDNLPKTPADQESMGVHSLGTQAGISARKLTSLWNALANLSLHAQVPASDETQIKIFGDAGSVHKKVSEVLEEISRISKGNLTVGGIGYVAIFKCSCGTDFKRLAGILQDGQAIYCPNLDCAESFDVERIENGFNYTRRTYILACKACDVQLEIPVRAIERVRQNGQYCEECKLCGTKHYIGWRAGLQQYQKTNEPVVSIPNA